jgi:hypothetical protein
MEARRHSRELRQRRSVCQARVPLGPPRPTHAGPTTMRNSRSSSRYRRLFLVTLGRTPSFTIDVCADGFCTESLRVLPPGTAVKGSINAKGAEFAFSGRVAWAMPADARAGLSGRMGVSFTSIAAGFAAGLNPVRRRAAEPRAAASAGAASG